MPPFPTDLTKEEKELLRAKRHRDATSWGKMQDRVNAPDVTIGELCYLARKRAGMTIPQLKRELGVSHVTIIKWERNRGNYQRLAQYWADRFEHWGQWACG